jgi:hypothetical protein
VAALFLYPPKGTPALNEQILQAIDDEIEKLRQVRAILTGTGQASSKLSPTPEKPRRQLSAKARRAIADAQRRRWAKVKSQKKAIPVKKEAAAS